MPSNIFTIAASVLAADIPVVMREQLPKRKRASKEKRAQRKRVKAARKKNR